MSIPVSVFTPSISVCGTPNCSKVNIWDTSGIYGSQCGTDSPNLTGWGLPNLDISTITTAVINVSLITDANLTLQASTLLNLNVFSVLPNTSGIPYILDLTAFGFGQAAPYYITLTYGDGTSTWVAEFYYIHLCTFDCCLKKKIADGCGCSSGSNADEVARLLRMVKDLACCAANLSGIFDGIKKLTKLCAPCGC